MGYSRHLRSTCNHITKTYPLQFKSKDCRTTYEISSKLKLKGDFFVDIVLVSLLLSMYMYILSIYACRDAFRTFDRDLNKLFLGSDKSR